MNKENDILDLEKAIAEANAKIGWRKQFFHEIAEELYNAGYRKVKDNQQVVYKAEWDYLIGKSYVKLQDEKDNAIRIKRNVPQIYHKLTNDIKIIPLSYEEVRKETAKEILEVVSKHYGGAWLIELYKEYGVEI